MQNPDKLLVLGGPERYRKARVEKAIDVYRQNAVPVILTGSHSGIRGISLLDGESRECDAMFNLLNNRIPDRDVKLEKDAKDTLGNFLFSEPFIGTEPNKVGIITDYFQMERGVWIFRKLFPKKEPIPLYATMSNPLVEALSQKMRLYATALDLRDIAPGNLEKIHEYMMTRNPMYTENARFSWTGLLVALERKAGILQKSKRL